MDEGSANPDRTLLGAWLLPLDGSGTVELPDSVGGEVRTRIPPGRWLLFVEGDPGRELDVPADGLRVSRGSGLVDLAVRWRLPDDLPAGARVRARVAVVPASVSAGGVRRWLAEEDDIAVPIELTPGLRSVLRVPPGRATLVVRSEVGRAEREVDVPPDGLEVEVTLGARSGGAR